MAYNGIAKVQHYVSQFLLRNFGNGKKDQLNVFDKQKARCFSANTRDIACESRFYDFQVDGEAFTMEPALSKIEGAAKPLLQRILDEDCLAVLSDDEQAQLAIFFSIQYTRIRLLRENWQMFPEMIREKMHSMVKDDEKLKYIDEYIRIPNENQTKKESFTSGSEEGLCGYYGYAYDDFCEHDQFGFLSGYAGNDLAHTEQ